MNAPGWRWAFFAAYLLVGAVSCRDAGLQQLATLADQVCACKDLACADAALQHMPKFRASNAERARQHGARMLTCYAQLSGASQAEDSNAADRSTVPNSRGTAEPTRADAKTAP